MTKTYHGSCHCGAVQFEVDIDLLNGSSRCNCTYCRKARAWSAFVKPEAFRLKSGEENLTSYYKNEHAPKKFFCKTCGVVTHGSGDAEYMGGPFVGIRVSALDDATPEELAITPISYSDGLNNNWQNPPHITSYL